MTVYKIITLHMHNWTTIIIYKIIPSHCLADYSGRLTISEIKKQNLTS
jgi:hypothetical protein